MISMVKERREELRQLCIKHHIGRLESFDSNSAGIGDSSENGLGFLVEIRVGDNDYGAYADAYFGLLEDLGDLFDRPVDLVTERAIKNSFLLDTVNQTRKLIYEA